VNTLAWVASLPATVWLMVYAVNDLGENALAVAAGGIFFISLGHLLIAAWEYDFKSIFQGGKKR